MEIPLFLGIDIAGEVATSVTVLADSGDRLEFFLSPQLQSLEEIFHLCESPAILAVTIDAPLTGAIGDPKGFRTSDHELRGLLLPRFRGWVQSANSLMAVPVRGRLLAEAISPLVGTILETHPRACLAFVAKTAEELEAVEKYKKDGAQHIAVLWSCWQRWFPVPDPVEPLTHDALDAVVCATIGYLYHRRPSILRRLLHNAVHRQGRGPFVVLEPAAHLSGDAAR